MILKIRSRHRTLKNPEETPFTTEETEAQGIDGDLESTLFAGLGKVPGLITERQEYKLALVTYNSTHLQSSTWEVGAGGAVQGQPQLHSEF